MSTTRIQLALNIDDVTAATAFYEKLFGVPPHKVLDGYANFAIEDPPLKLVLIEKPGADEHLNHLGVEAVSEVPEQKHRATASPPKFAPDSTESPEQERSSLSRSPAW